MTKEFLEPHFIRDNAIILADKIYKDGILPTIIYVSLRGGATFGNVISEYFKLRSQIPHVPLYAAVVAHSYNTYSSSEILNIDGWTYHPKFIRPSDIVLLVDDIFDSGKTINVLAKKIMSKGIKKEHLKVVVHDYKIRTFKNEHHTIFPDYYSRKIIIDSPEKDTWIHYLSHELDGLHTKEIDTHYSPRVASIVKELCTFQQNKKK